MLVLFGALPIASQHTDCTLSICRRNIIFAPLIPVLIALLMALLITLLIALLIAPLISPLIALLVA